METISSQHLPRVRALDGLRGLAVVAVLLHHLFRYAPDTFVGRVVERIAGAGYLGVDLFFVLSGFLITGILLATREDENYFSRFFWRRSLRIFPLYYATLLFVFVVFRPLAAHFTSLQPVAGDPLAYFFYVSNFAIARAGEFSWRPTDVTWSLAVEEQFYLIFPLIVRFVPRRSLLPTFVGLALTALLARTAATWVHGSQAWIACYVLPFCRLDALSLGAVLAWLVREPSPRFARIFAWISDAALVAFPFLVLGEWVGQAEPFMMTAGYSVVALAMVALVRRALVPSRLAAGLNAPVLVHLGTRSYGIYLLHSLVEGVLRRAPVLRNYFGDEQLQTRALPSLVFFALSVGITLIVAELSFRYFESPLLALRDRRPAVA